MAKRMEQPLSSLVDTRDSLKIKKILIKISRNPVDKWKDPPYS